MQIIIDIPKEFEEHFKVDRFEDSLVRIESDIESFGLLAGRYEQETITMLREAIKNGTPLPKGCGRLIDANNITFSEFFDAGDYAQAMRGIYNAPTIIEAEGE